MTSSMHGTDDTTESSTVPTDPAQLTAEWLGSVLGEEVSDVLVEAVGTGQTGATYRITPTYAQPSSLPRSLIAKLPSQVREVRERVAIGYRAEHAFYTSVADTVSVPLPRIYHCEISSDGTEFVLLMSDMSPAAQGDQIRGCSDVEARLAVAAIAGLHGPRWCDAEWLSLDGVAMPMATADIARGMGEVARFALDTTLSGIGDRISAPDRAILNESADRMERWLRITPERFSLLHGDYRLDNLLFDPAGTSITIVDWQTIAVGLPARDLAYFIGTSMEPTRRAETESDLVATYHRRLLDYGVAEYSAETCWNDYRVGMLQIPLITTFGYAFAATTDRGDDMMLAMIARGCRAIDQLGTLDLIDQLA